MTKEQLQENYKTVLDHVKIACEKSGRNPSQVTVVAVSKTKPLEMIEDAILAGMSIFGENKPQEIRDKTAKVSKEVHWHMIGKLQSNKIKYVIESCELIHSIDSLKLAMSLNKEALKRNRHVNVLLQVNVSGEVSKSGFTVEQLYNQLEEIALLSHVHVQGLMTIPPFVTNPEDNRKYFKQLREISIDIKSKNIDNITMNALSMGMTGDYPVAIEEGATYVRVGTGIFGERNYNK